MVNTVQHGLFQTTSLVWEPDVGFPSGHVGRDQDLGQSEIKQHSFQSSDPSAEVAVSGYLKYVSLWCHTDG